MKCCKTCQLWDYESAKDKGGKVRADYSARCRWVSKELWPSAVAPMSSRVKATWSEARGGVECKCYAPTTDITSEEGQMKDFPETTEHQKKKARELLSTLTILFPKIEEGPKQRCPICCEADLDCATCVLESVAQHFPPAP